MKHSIARLFTDRRRQPVFPVRTAFYTVHQSRGGIGLLDLRQDYVAYLRAISRIKRDLKLRVYAFCLLPNAVHMLVDPHYNPARAHEFVRELAAWQSHDSNATPGATMGLWQPDPQVFAIQKGESLIGICSSIEQQPVEQCLVVRAADYPWSSWRSHAQGVSSRLVRNVLDDFPEFLELGPSKTCRNQAYTNAALVPSAWHQQLACRAMAADRLVQW